MFLGPTQIRLVESVWVEWGIRIWVVSSKLGSISTNSDKYEQIRTNLEFYLRTNSVKFMNYKKKNWKKIGQIRKKIE